MTWCPASEVGARGCHGSWGDAGGFLRPLYRPVSARSLRVGSVNGEFAHWLEASGLNKKEFARRVQTRAHAKGLRHVSTAASRVRGWLAGQQPTEPKVAQIVADVLSEACRRPLTIQDIGFRVSAARRRSDPAELAVIPGLAETLSSQSRTDLIVTSRDVRAEEADIASGDALLDAVEHIALGQPALVPDLFSLPRIGGLHVAQIEQTANAFRRWDNEFGSGMRRKAVVGQLNEAAELLKGPFQDDRVARRLFSAVADLAQLAGWMSYDLQLHATAQRYFLLGMHLAKDAGDRPQVGRMLYCLARQMVDLQRYREALDLAQTGMYAIRRSTTPKTMALLHVIEARAHAGMGQTGDCTRALGAAQDAFAQAGQGTDPACCAFFDEGELYGLLGVTLRDLALADTDHAGSHAADARHWIEQAIQQRPRNFLRSRVMDMDGLAVVNVLLGEPEAAGQAAATAMTMATAVTSARVMSRLRRTAWLAQARFPDASDIGGLRDQVAALPSGANRGQG